MHVAQDKYKLQDLGNTVLELSVLQNAVLQNAGNSSIG
jgi:hypothetical protein